MKIGFLLGSPGISGGSYVIYEHASRLKRRGHQVAIITRHEVNAAEYSWHPCAHELDWLYLEQARAESFDVLLATWWKTPLLFSELQSVHYAYFVQSIESRFFPPPDPQHYKNLDRIIWREMCDKTYSYAVPMLTEAAWIQEYLYKNYNNQAWLVRNGIRKDIYTVDGETIDLRKPDRFRVLVEGPVDVFFKNVPTAIKLAKEAGVDEIWLLTSSAIQQYPGVDRVFSQIPIHETPAVYRSCDLVLKLSYVEGMFGPPLEMFHCGGTALVYDVTGHDEYIVHDQNSYVVAKDNEQEVVRLLQHLKDNPQELARLKQGAAETAAAWPDWEICSTQFEQALREIVAGKPVSREYLVRYTKELLDSLQPSINAKIQEAFAAREQADWTGAAVNRNNFCRFYWDGQGEFTDRKLQHRHYLSGEWTTLSFELPVEETPLWLRLDPSLRIGITELAFITVRNISQDREIMAFREQEEFQLLFLAQDLKWICPERKNLLFTYGHAPIILLPRLEENSVALGDLLEVSVRLKETGMQQLSITERQTHEAGDSRNSMRLHWDGAGKFNRKKSLLQPYPSDEWTTVSFELSVQESPLWLRLDPSCRAALLELASITVHNKTQDREIMRLQKQEEFQLLLLSADLTWIFPERKDIVFSCGADPFLIMPKIEQDKAALDDLLEIRIKLKETSPQHFFKQHQVCLTDRTVPRWKRLLQLFKKNL
ncbi:glycosyltransferase family 4 protein [Candidatus Electronema sp. PJ]|uniref:glycosyltransferase family 4 protein n=1 Tax=Candidatus Electronema sp. PJ TaxID=3401572 RepID=UPI003AA80632